MPQDTFTASGEDWPPTAEAPPAAPPAPPVRPVHHETNRAESGGRLHRLLWIFALLTMVLVTPSVIGRVAYEITSAQERARHDVAKANRSDLKFDQINSAYRMIPQLVSPSVVNVRTSRGRGEGQGSGVIVDKEGYIVTNNHVVDGLETAEIHFSDGRSAPASVIGVDPLTDIAVLKTEIGNLIPAEWGDSDTLEVGDLVWALGSPFGLEKSLTQGVLSAKERRGITGTRVIQEFLQTDAAVNPGNSGGPLVNSEGKVIGINTAIIGPSYQGISFAIPSELAKASYDQIRDHGYVLRGFLGITPQQVPAQMSRALALERNEGVWVYSVDPNTPAAEAGLERDDVILAWNGEAFSDPTVLSQAIAATPIGSEVPVKLVRVTNGGPKSVEVKVKVAARPQVPRGR